MDLYRILRLSIYLVATAGAVAIWDVEADLTPLLAVVAAAGLAHLTVDAGRLRPIRPALAAALAAALLLHFGLSAWAERSPEAFPAGIVRMMHFLCALQVLLFFTAFRGSLVFTFCGANLFILIVSGCLDAGASLLVRLALFLAASTWLLFVHTLWIERRKFESRQTAGPGPAGRSETQGRLSERALWQGLKLIAGLTAACLVFGFLLFFAWPRGVWQRAVRSLHYTTAPAARGHPGPLQPDHTPVVPRLPRTGPGEVVALEDLGPIQVDSSPALRVVFDRPCGEVAASGGYLYLRDRVMSAYREKSWLTPPAGLRLNSPAGFVDFPDHDPRFLEPPGPAPLVRQRVRLLGQTYSHVYFGLTPMRRLGGGAVTLDEEGAVFAAAPDVLTAGREYELYSNRPVFPEQLPPDAKAASPAPRYLDWLTGFPHATDARAVSALQARLLWGAQGDRQKALRLRDYLRDSGHYRYSLQPGPSAPDADPLCEFLLSSDRAQRRGPCGYFASAFVVLGRAAGLPARLAAGFVHSLTSDQAASVEAGFINSEAHAWGEVYFEGYGWVAFDPTPPGAPEAPLAPPVAAQPPDPEEAGGSFSSAGEGLVSRGWEYFLKYDNREQDRIYQSLGTAMDRTLQGARDLFAGGDAGMAGPVVAWVVVAVLGGAVVALFWQRQERRRSAVTALPPRQRAAVTFYLELLHVLSKRGFVRRTAQTPREFARAVVQRGGQALAPVLTVTEIFERVRYGGEDLAPSEREVLQVALSALQQYVASPPHVATPGGAAGRR